MGEVSVGFGNCKYGAVIALIIRAIRAIRWDIFEIRAMLARLGVRPASYPIPDEPAGHVMMMMISIIIIIVIMCSRFPHPLSNIRASIFQILCFFSDVSLGGRGGRGRACRLGPLAATTAEVLPRWQGRRWGCV